jgi:DNA-binding NarL/FixJ family response regulator
VKVYVVDDSVLLREGVVRLLADAGFDVVGQQGDTRDLTANVTAAGADVVVLDIRMPPTHTVEGLDAAMVLRREHREIGVLLLSQYVETQFALDLLADGADGVGYLLKDRVADIDEFVAAVTRVGTGGVAIDPLVVSRMVSRERRRNPLGALSERERDVLALMAEGRSNLAIAERLVVNTRTVESHVGSILTKLGVSPEPDDHRRVRAVLLYLAHQDGEGSPVIS